MALRIEKLMTPPSHPWARWAGSEHRLPLYHLGPGVIGRAFHRKDGLTYIQFIEAEHPSSGDVGRFLDRLSPECRIVCVVNDQLRAMLKRRNWRLEHTEIEKGEEMDVWTRS